MSKERPENLVEMFENSVEKHGNNKLFGTKNKAGEYEWVTYDQVKKRVDDLRAGLAADGFLKITGRIKEQFKLLNGKYVFPASIEEDIKLIPLVANAMIYGEGKDYNICLVVPDFEVCAKHTEMSKPAEMVADANFTKMIQDKIVEALTGTYGGYEIPKEFVFLAEDFTIDNGMLTQTLKLKRRAVVDTYKAEIDKAYS